MVHYISMLDQNRVHRWKPSTRNSIAYKEHDYEGKPMNLSLILRPTGKSTEEITKGIKKQIKLDLHCLISITCEFLADFTFTYTYETQCGLTSLLYSLSLCRIKRLSVYGQLITQSI